MTAATQEKRPKGKPGRRKGDGISDEERHDMVVRKIRGESPSELAKEFGVSRTWVYKAVDIATTDAEAKLEDAEREFRFRRDVLDALNATRGL